MKLGSRDVRISNTYIYIQNVDYVELHYCIQLRLIYVFIDDIYCMYILYLLYENYIIVFNNYTYMLIYIHIHIP